MNNIFEQNILKEDTLPVVYVTNDNDCIYTLISMMSVLENTNQYVEFVILFKSLSDDSIAIIDKILEYENCNIIYVELLPHMFGDVSALNSETVLDWYKIAIPHVLSKADKAIYLSSATLVRGDISELYETDLNTNYVAGVTDVWSVDYNVKRLGIKDKSYINTDVLLLNCDLWRKKDLSQKIFDCAKENVATFFRLPDVLNFVANKKKMLLSTKFNYIETWWHDNLVQYKGDELVDYEANKKNPLIVNFTVYKPDDEKSKHSFKDEWLKYHKKYLSELK